MTVEETVTPLPGGGTQTNTKIESIPPGGLLKLIQTNRISGLSGSTLGIGTRSTLIDPTT